MNTKINDFIIRPANINDVKPCAAMDEICFSLPWSEQSFFEEIVGNEIAQYIIAEAEGNVIGYAGIWAILDEGHITNIAVHPDFRRKGIARTLISALLEETGSNGVKAYTLEVRASNESAIALYKGLGFKHCGVRKKYYDDNDEDAVIMWKT